MPRHAVAARTGIAVTSCFCFSGTRTSSTVATAGITTNRERKSIASAPHPEIREDQHDAEQGDGDVAVQVSVEDEAHHPSEPLRELADPADDALHEHVLLEEPARVRDALLHLADDPEID